MPTHRKQTAHYQSIIASIEAIPDGRKYFTEEEDEIIRKYYPTKGSKIAPLMGKTVGSVGRRASKLGVLYGKTP